MSTMKVEITLIEEMLGTASSNPELYRDYIADNAPTVDKADEEFETVVGGEIKGKTVFSRDEDGTPILWDYQIRGFFKDAAGVLRKVPKKKSAALKSYKKYIDGLIFVDPRKIRINMSGLMGECQRPLRAQTMQGERVALAFSETVPAGSTLIFEINCLNDDGELIREWLDYGRLRGLGQWRNSGKGRFVWREIE